MPPWPPTLGALDPALLLGVGLILALLAGRAAQRHLGWPRLSGALAVGAVLGPVGLGLLDATDLAAWRPLLDLAVGLLVFELGSRLKPRWLLDNPGLTLQLGVQALAVGLLVGLGLVALGMGGLPAAVAAAVAVSSSPLVALGLLHGARPRGQVTERMLHASAWHSALACLLLAVLAAASGVDGATAGSASAWWAPALRALLLLLGSVLLGLAAGLLLDGLGRWLQADGDQAVLQLALLSLTSLLASLGGLSALLSLLVAGLVARARLGHRLSVTPQLGSAGAALHLLLFLSLGLMARLDGLGALGATVAVLLGARALGLVGGALLTARASGLSLRQALALGLAQQTLTPPTLLLGGGALTAALLDTGPQLAATLLLATTLGHALGPLLGQWALARLAGETAPPPAPAAAERAPPPPPAA